MSLKHYLIEIFEPTILFGFLPALLGVVAAWHYHSLNPVTGALAVIGVLFAQISVNLIDDYVDYTSGLDKDTVKTKFSGGSSLVVKKLVRLDYVLAIGVIFFLAAASIGCYLIYRNVLLLPFALIGALTVLLYAAFLSRVPFLAEPLVALNFALVCLGCFVAAGGPIGNLGLVAFAAIPAGIQVGLAVIVNYLPDREPDRKHGRRNAVVMIGSNRGTAALYLSLEAIAYLLVISGAILGAIPLPSLLVVITVPVVLGIACEIAGYKNPKAYEKAMANAAMAELAFILMLVIAFA